MGKLRECKGCTSSVRVKVDETYEKLKATLMDEDMAVSKETYKSRLDICKVCPSLQYSTTCQHCGCLVHARVLGKDSYCPDPSGSRW